MAADTGGRTQPASGALPGAKGDVRHKGQYRGECKFTRNKSFKLSLDLLEKISAEAMYPEYPVLDVQFLDSAGREVDRWVAIPYDTWKELHAAKHDR